MSSYLLIRIAHSLPAVLLVVGVLVHIIMVWRAGRKEPEVLSKKLQRTYKLSLPLFVVVTLSLPISGWWLVHLSGMPMSLFWLQLSIMLLPLVFIFFGLLRFSLGRWQQRLTAKQPAQKQAVISLVLGSGCLFTLIAISALMGAKPL